MPNLLIPIALRPYADRQAEIEVDGANVRAALEALTTTYPQLGAQIFDETGELRGFINVFVGSDNIKTADGLDTAVKPDDEVAIVPAIAGGM
ncbi:MAG: MoaD/ThiS family protein [Propionibacteriaceae bacterium]|jgi:molybdopterin converting factor small subunit|nr:MoaD/ThiS family protein [Propionibacteriaceae bacterium]